MKQQDVANFRYELRSRCTFSGRYLNYFLATPFLVESCRVLLATAVLSDLVSVSGSGSFRSKNASYILANKSGKLQPTLYEGHVCVISKDKDIEKLREVEGYRHISLCDVDYRIS